MKCVEDHQTNLYYKAGIPIVICTDDKGVFCCTLSSEYRIAAEIFHWSKKEVFAISNLTINHIFADNVDKTHLKSVWSSWKLENLGMEKE